MKQIFAAKGEASINIPKNLLPISTRSGMFVLFAVIAAQNFLPTDLSSPFIVLLGLGVMVFGKIQTFYLKLLRPLLGVLIIGFFGVFNHELRDTLRDIAFALSPISLICIGCWLADNKAMRRLILKIFLIFAFVLAVAHLSIFMLKPELLSGDLNTIRKESLGSGLLVVIGLVLGLFQHRLGINLFPRLLPRFIVMPVLLASFTLSYSRTELLVGVVFTLSMLGWVSGINRRLMFAVVVIMVGFIAIAMSTPEDEVGTFRSKLVRSVTEVTVSDYDDLSDINSNWRGYEAQKAVDSFTSGNAFEWILGQGFGAQADLGLYMKLGEEEYRYIAVLHNGYAYILLKTGLLGLACYVCFYITVIRYAVRDSNSINNTQKFLARLLLGSVLSLVLTMMVVGGMAEKHNSEIVLLLGYLVKRLGQVQAHKSRIGVLRVS